MGTLKHPIVEDRIIQGEGTALEEWQQSQQLANLKLFDFTSIFPVNHRICIIAPHPDDEIMGCAGMIQQLDAAGYEIVLFAVTNGTASHPNSSLYTPEQLDLIRPRESLNALQTLNLSKPVQRIALNIQDGEVAQQRDQLAAALKQYLKSHDILVTAFEYDGHPDHEITGQVCKQVSIEMSLKCLQVLIWAWHWANPEDARIPWHKALKLELSSRQLKLKSKAMQCFKSQLEPDLSTGNDPIVSASALERLLQPWEVYIYDQGCIKHDYFAELYRENNGDPWRYEQRWYEQRKRDITLAVLPQPSFSTGIEIGCSNGVLSSELAKRCEYLICMDANPTAIQLANQRLTHDHVKVVQGIVPLDLPEQQFDLIVASEVLYYLEEQILQQLIYWVNTHLSPNGCIVACNEELEIANCLQALERARQYFYQHQSQTKNIDIEILVVLDSCTDRTLEIIKTYNVSMISCTYRCVGQTRDLGIRYLIEQGCDWICCTDADSRVSLDWFTSMLKHQPTHVICGVVEIAEWQHLSDATRQDYLSHYQDRTGHRHIHGANLCFRASSYLALGGFKAMPCHEDVDLVKRAEKIGLHISWSNQLRVITSSRLNSRVDEGFSRFLRVIEQENLHEYSSESALRKIV